MDTMILEQFPSIKNNLELMIQNGNTIEASKVIEKIDEIIPYDIDIISMKTVINYINNNIDMAEQYAKVGLILDPTNTDLLYNLYVMLGNLNRTNEAILFLSKSIEFSNDNQEQEVRMKELLQMEYSNQLKISFLEDEANFTSLLLKNIYRNLSNNFYYNVDLEMLQYMEIPFHDVILVNTMEERKSIVDNIYGLSYLYHLLDDSGSKELLIKLLSFRILGNKKIKLPLNNSKYWNQRQSIRNLILSSETLNSPFHNWTLNLFDLTSKGYDIRMFYTPMAISATFFDKQYEYKYLERRVKVNRGDIVIDCGGCWGDTALYFAHEVGEHGSVYTMEFIPSNISILERNLSLNPVLQERITIVKNPVWSKSNESLYFHDQGPASTVSSIQESTSEGQVYTLSIDDLVNLRNIQRVDFIKMDIEGAELSALHGAINTIRKYRPTLALAIYHKVEDFHEIPKLIDGLKLNYKFYLGHYTIQAQETVLFAVPD